MQKLNSWFLNSTLSIVLVCIVSLFFGFGQWGASTNTFLVLFGVLAYIYSRGEEISNAWAHMCLATMFTTSAAASGISLAIALVRPESVGSPEWRFISGLIAALALSCAILGAVVFALKTARDLKTKYGRTLSLFTIQGVVLHILFRYMIPLVSKFYGS